MTKGQENVDRWKQPHPGLMITVDGLPNSDKGRHEWKIAMGAKFQEIVHKRRVYKDGCAYLLSLDFFFKKPKSQRSICHVVKPDVAKLVKDVLEAGESTLWPHSSEVISCEVRKLYAGGVQREPGLVMMLWRVENAKRRVKHGRR